VPNRLAGATSPYLLQHADNPVDWWEWGEDAFAEARRRNVPVLLSVGYSACHWCHEVKPSTAIPEIRRNRRSSLKERGRVKGMARPFFLPST
jgi:hypothetical protein